MFGRTTASVSVISSASAVDSSAMNVSTLVIVSVVASMVLTTVPSPSSLTVAVTVSSSSGPLVKTTLSTV